MPKRIPVELNEKREKEALLLASMSFVSNGFEPAVLERMETTKRTVSITGAFRKVVSEEKLDRSIYMNVCVCLCKSKFP